MEALSLGLNAAEWWHLVVVGFLLGVAATAIGTWLLGSRLAPLAAEDEAKG